MANIDGNKLISDQVVDSEATATPVEQELVSILKKSGKRATKAGRDKMIEPSKVSSGGSDSQDQVLVDISEHPSVKVKVSRGVGSETAAAAATTTTTTNKQSTQKKAQKPRRRVATVAQRRAANIRERRRMFNLNAAFDRLRKKVPSFAYEKRLSRIETLKLAIMYIRFMDNLVNDDAYAEKYKQLTTASGSSGSAAASSFLSSGTYLSLYGHCSAGSANGNGNGLFGRDESPTSPVKPHTNHQKPRPISSVESVAKQRRGQSGCESAGEVGAAFESANIDFKTALGGGHRLEEGQYYEPPHCQTAGQQQQQIQQYRASIALPTSSPISCGSIACCSSPNSTSATTCHSVSSTFIESPNSRSPTTSTGPSVAGPKTVSAPQATEPTALYYPNQAQYNGQLPAYPPHNNYNHDQASLARHLYHPTSDPYELNTDVSSYNNNSSNHHHPLETQKSLDSYNHHQQPLDASIAHQQANLLMQGHHQQAHHLAANCQQDDYYHNHQQLNSQQSRQNERIKHQVSYSLHSLEAI